jgi:hypothetical protein
MRRTLSFILASVLLAAGLALAAFEMPNDSAADLTYMRCTYTAPFPADPKRFVIITVEPDHQLIRFGEHGEVLNDTTVYRLTEMNDTTVKGAMVDKDGDEQRLEIDRVSGRAILYVDVTRVANIGRPVKPGERQWSSMSLNCQKTKPVL